MRATRRRPRTPDPLASPPAVRSVIEQLRSSLPHLIPHTHQELVRLLRAARHAQRYPASETGRGRPGRWGRAELLKVAARLGEILDRETASRISFASFVDHYLRVPEFPADVLAALAGGEINLFEAGQLARVAAARLGATPGQAKRTRAALLCSHLRTGESGGRLRQRVNELLGVAVAGTGEEPGGASAAAAEDLEDFDPYDSTHLFWEQLKQLGFAFREIRREDVTDAEVEELLKASEPILAILSRIRRRRERRKVIKVRL